MTSETSLGSTPARRSASPIAISPSLCAGRLASPPLNAPTGVRTAPAMTISAIGRSPRRVCALSGAGGPNVKAGALRCPAAGRSDRARPDCGWRRRRRHAINAAALEVGSGWTKGCGRPRRSCRSTRRRVSPTASRPSPASRSLPRSWRAPARRAFAGAATAFRPCCTSFSSSRCRSMPRRRCTGGSARHAGRSRPSGFSPSTTRACAGAASAGKRPATPATSPKRCSPANSILPGSPKPTTKRHEAALRSLKGIGRWSTEVYLIFALGRPDIWPAADLGLQLGARECLGLAARPAEPELRALGEQWRPWRAVASCLFWQSYLHTRRRTPPRRRSPAPNESFCGEARAARLLRLLIRSRSGGSGLPRCRRRCGLVPYHNGNFMMT